MGWKEILTKKWKLILIGIILIIVWYGFSILRYEFRLGEIYVAFQNISNQEAMGIISKHNLEILEDVSYTSHPIGGPEYVPAFIVKVPIFKEKYYVELFENEKDVRTVYRLAPRGISYWG